MKKNSFIFTESKLYAEVAPGPHNRRCFCKIMLTNQQRLKSKHLISYFRSNRDRLSAWCKQTLRSALPEKKPKARIHCRNVFTVKNLQNEFTPTLAFSQAKSVDAFPKTMIAILMFNLFYTFHS